MKKKDYYRIGFEAAALVVACFLAVYFAAVLQGGAL